MLAKYPKVIHKSRFILTSGELGRSFSFHYLPLTFTVYLTHLEGNQVRSRNIPPVDLNFHLLFHCVCVHVRFNFSLV